MGRKLDVGIEIELDDNGAIKKVRGLDQALTDLEPAATKASGGINKAGMAVGALGVAVGALAAKGLFDLGVAAIKTGANFETLGIQMSAVMGGKSGGAEATAWIKQFTLETPYQLEQVSAAFVKLKAMGLDPMNGTMQSIADMTSFLGGSMESMDTIVLALGKSFAKGKMQTEEMNMMMEKGVPVTRLLADALGKDEQAIFDMATAGELGRKEIQLLIDAMGEMTSGSSVALMDTFAGKWSNLQDNISNALNEIAEGGLLDAATKGLSAIIDLIDDFVSSGAAAELGKALADGLELAIPVIEKVSTGLNAFMLGFVAIRKEINELKLDGARKEFAKLSIEFAILKKTIGSTGKITAEQGKRFRELTKELPKLGFKVQELNADVEAGGETMQNLADMINGVQEEVEKVDLTKPREEIEDTVDQALLDFDKLKNKALLTVGKDGAVARSIYSFFAQVKNGSIVTFGGVATDMEAAEKRGKGLWKALEDDSEDAFDFVTGAFSDMLGKGFMGEWETFSDLWDALWTDAAKSMAGIIGNAFEDAMKDGGTLGGIGARFWDNMKTSIEKNPLGAGVAGAGMIMQGREQGGAGGVMQGLMGGMSMGGAIGSLFPGAGTAIGMGIGAVVGAAVAFFGGGDDPRTGYTYGSGGFNVTSSDGQDLGPGAWVQWEKNMNALVRESKLAYRGLLKMFGDPDLFNLVGALGEFSVGRAGTLEDVAAYIADEWLPSQMDTVFGQAMRKGFGDLGLGEGEIDNLFAELGQLGGEDRVNALQDIVAALVMFNEALTDFGSGSALLDILDQNPMEAFADSMAEVRDNIDLVTVGWENMSLQDRAREAQEIGVLFQGALQTTLQLLQQIDQVRGSINQSFESMIEGFALGGMTDAQKQQYYQDQIGSLTGQLGSATDAAEIAQITADIQRYIQSLGGMFDGEDLMGAGFGGTTWNEYLSGLATAAQEAANARLDMIEQEVLSEYDALVARMREAEEALTGFTDAVNNAGGGTGVGGGGGGNEQGQVAPKSTTVNVTVGGEMAPLINLIYSIVDDRVGGDPNSIQ